VSGGGLDDEDTEAFEEDLVEKECKKRHGSLYNYDARAPTLREGTQTTHRGGDGFDDENTKAFEEDFVEKREEHEGSDVRESKTKDTKGTKDEDIRGTEDEGSKDNDTRGTEDITEKVTRFDKHEQDEK
jgi:hypothetical protein